MRLGLELDAVSLASFVARPHEGSIVLPEIYQEVQIRVFTRDVRYDPSQFHAQKRQFHLLTLCHLP
jgi:hypothetical protein